MSHDYNEVDAQLLIEVRVARYLDRPLPMSLVRVLAARGWAHDPQSSELIEVRAALEGDPDATLDEYSQTLARPRLTRAGENELELHRRYFGDELLEDLAEIEDEEELEEWEEDED